MHLEGMDKFLWKSDNFYLLFPNRFRIHETPKLVAMALKRLLGKIISE